MAKRQVRVEKQLLSGYLDQGHYINFVMKNGSVILANPITLQSEQVKIKNTKGHTLLLPLAQIDEIWAEEKAR